MYFGRYPRIPKSLLRENREGIIVGSACEAGELFRAIVHNKPQEEVDRIASFYDYLEIQPLVNDRFYIENGTLPDEEALKREMLRLFGDPAARAALGARAKAAVERRRGVVDRCAEELLLLQNR